MALKVKALQVYKSDEELETNGKWAEIAEGVEFRIRRMRSTPVEDAREKIYGPYERAMGNRKKKAIPATLETQLTVRLLSEAVIVDWRGPGMVDDNGVAIPFTTENAAEVLSDPDTGKDLRSTVINLSMDAEFFDPSSDDSKVDEKN